MDTYKLKILAITTMLIDHVGAVLVYGTNNDLLYFACRAVGRLAFPIFAFLIVEGYYHTRDVRKYLMRLLAFAAISEIPFDLAFYQYDNNIDAITDFGYIFKHHSYSSVVIERLMNSQNVFFTLFLGLLLITLFGMVDMKFIKNDYKNIVIGNSLDCALTAVICGIAYVLKTDYDVAGIMIIVSFYLFRDSIALMGIALFIISGSMLCQFMQFRVDGNLIDIVGIFATLAIIPIALYNGKKGKSAKYFFYAFYPVHLIILFLITIAIKH